MDKKNGESRNDLMLKAKEKGIKNFRILNKEELLHILAKGITKQEIEAIISGAIARWKSGWGKGKKRKELISDGDTGKHKSGSKSAAKKRNVAWVD